MKTKFLLLVISILVSSTLIGQSTNSSTIEAPNISANDRIRISEAFRVAEEIGDSIWIDWNKTPFAVLLVTNEYEFLIRHPNPSDDFTFISYDSLLESNIYFREKNFQTNILATFPAVNDLSTVVVGQPENTSSTTSTRWVLTLLHEHFHQLQNFQPDHYSSVDSLNLSRGDKTGMWMLNYAFPYDSTNVKETFSELCIELSNVVSSIGNDDFETKLIEYLNRRKDFEEILSSDDYKYFSFQNWQEGVARYTEYALAKYGSLKYKPTKKFENLTDYTTLKADADSNYIKILSTLPNIDLGEYRRVAFYYFGSAEAILLDFVNPNWKTQYFKDKFFLEKYYKK